MPVSVPVFKVSFGGTDFGLPKIPNALLPSCPTLLPFGTAVHSTLAQGELSGWRPTASNDLSWLELNKSEWELVNLDLNTGYKQLLRVKWNYLRREGSCKGALDPLAIKMFIFLADVPPSPTPEEEEAPSPPPVPALKTELEPASTEVRAY